MARKKTPKTVYTVDMETDPFLFGRAPKPFAIGLYGPDDYAEFWGDDCVEQFIQHIAPMENCVFYAHNGGKFDFFFLLKYLDPELMLINGRIAKATINDKMIELRDSWLILPLPLASYQKTKIEYSKFERENREQHKREILNYLRDDCRDLYDWVTMFIGEYGNGLTLAGTALNELKKTSYIVGKTNDYFDETFREFYFGGRVQCFEVGAILEPLKYYDIKSAYPFAMLHNHWTGDSFRKLKTLPDGDNWSWFAEIDAISKGALPFKQDNKLYFPDDDTVRTYRATGWEINAGLETKTLSIINVRRVYYPTLLDNFGEYVNKFYALKLHAEQMIEAEPAKKQYWSATRQFAKLLLNSCYGKFGQDGRKFEKFVLEEYGSIPDQYKGRDGEQYDWNLYCDKPDLGVSVFNRPDPSNDFYNVATAASITGFVRAYLWRHICSSTRPVYCDTDSIICAEFVGRESDALGDWEKEADIKEAYIAQRKMYALLTDNAAKPWKTASKGVKLTAEQIREGVLSRTNIVSERDAPAYSIKYGPRFFDRTTDFKNLEKNACNNPPQLS